MDTPDLQETQMLRKQRERQERDRIRHAVRDAFPRNDVLLYVLSLLGESGRHTTRICLLRRTQCRLYK